MRFIRYSISALVIGGVLLCTNCAIGVGQERRDHHELIDFLDQRRAVPDDTFVASIDLQNKEIDALFTAIPKVLTSVGLIQDKWEEQANRLTTVVATLRRHKISKVYVLGFLPTLARGEISLLIPATSDQIDILQNEFVTELGADWHATANGDFVVAPLGGDLFVGTRDEYQVRLTTKSMGQYEGPILPEPSNKHFFGWNDAAIQIVALPNDFLRALREMNPTLPTDLGITSREIADNVRGITLSVKGGRGTIGLRLAIQASSDHMASQLRLGLQQAWRGVATNNGLDDNARLRIETAWLPQIVDNKLLVLEIADVNATLEQSGLVASLLRPLHEANRDAKGMQQLKEVGLACWNFESTYGSFPPSASYDAGGQPLLSWRVHLLPFLGHRELYNQFHWNEPWNSEHNRTLIPKMPAVYLSRGLESRTDGKTCLLAPVGAGAMWYGKAGTVAQSVSDELSQTMLLVEVAPKHAVTWTAPDDWSIDWNNPVEMLRRSDGRLLRAILADGAVRSFAADTDSTELLKFLRHDDTVKSVRQ